MLHGVPREPLVQRQIRAVLGLASLVRELEHLLPVGDLARSGVAGREP
jgi:hypothetical protein